MTAAYSMDLRERALARKVAGETHRQIAEALQIAPSCVSKWGYGDTVRNPGPERLSSLTLGSAADGQTCARRCPRPAAQQVPIP